MIKGVHQLTLSPNTLISLIDHFTIFNGWMDNRADPGVDPGFLSGEGGPGPTARIQDPHMGPIHTYVHMHTCIVCIQARSQTHIRIYIRMYRQAHVCPCTGRRIDIHVQV